MKARPSVLAHHMDLYARKAFTEFSREYILNKVCMLLVDPRWVPDMDPTTLLDYISIGFLTELRNAVATDSFWFRQAMEVTLDPGYLTTEGYLEGHCEYSRFVGMTSIRSLNNGATSNDPMVDANHALTTQMGATPTLLTQQSMICSWPNTPREEKRSAMTSHLYVSGTWPRFKTPTTTQGMMINIPKLVLPHKATMTLRSLTRLVNRPRRGSLTSTTWQPRTSFFGNGSRLTCLLENATFTMTYYMKAAHSQGQAKTWLQLC